MRPLSCQEEALFSNQDCTIWQCRCGIYHVRIYTMKLHLTMGRMAAFEKAESVTLGEYDAKQHTQRRPL